MALKKKDNKVIPFKDFAEELEKNLVKVQEDPEYAAELASDQEGNPMTLGPRVVDADAWVEDMTTAAVAKSSKWLANTLKPKKDPKERARKAAKKYDSNMRAALDENRWEAGINAYDEDLRQETIAAVGESGYRSGITTKKAKVKARIAKLQPLVAALTNTLDKMPVDTAEQRAQKMIAARDGMLAVKKQMRA